MPFTTLPAPSSPQRRLLDQDMRDTLKSYKDAMKDGRQADAAQCAQGLLRMAADPLDWLASVHPEGK